MNISRSFAVFVVHIYPGGWTTGGKGNLVRRIGDQTRVIYWRIRGPRRIVVAEIRVFDTIM